MFKALCILLVVGLTSGCSVQYVNQNPINKTFPAVSGESLEGDTVDIPQAFSGKPTLLLVGYKQDSQFDIDRWLIGLDMTQTAIDVYEIPTIAGLAPRMFKPYINNGMRAGIPKELWKGVITVYADGDLVQEFTGNQSPNNARCILLDSEGKIRYFYDQGFSVNALNNLRDVLTQI